jgi:hypothetical protein
MFQIHSDVNLYVVRYRYLNANGKLNDSDRNGSTHAQNYSLLNYVVDIILTIYSRPKMLAFFTFWGGEIL